MAKLSPGLTLFEFLSTNSSFINCERFRPDKRTSSNDDITDTQFTLQQSFNQSSASYSFTNCNFSNCHVSETAVDNHGGAIFFNGTSGTALSVDGCTFTNCGCYSETQLCCGGAISCLSECSVTNSAFVNCSCQSSVSAYGGGIYFYLSSSSSSSSSSFTITHSTFTNCSCQNGSGGAIYISAESLSSDTTLTPSLLHLSSLSFDSCIGQPVFVTSSSESNEISGESGSGVSSLPSTAVVIATISLSAFLDYDTWNSLLSSSSYTASEDGSLIGAVLNSSHTPISSLSLHHLIFSPSSANQSQLFLSGTSGVEYATCGWLDIPCNSVNTAKSNRQTTSTLTLIHSTPITSQINIASTELPLTLESQNTSSIQTLTILLSDESADSLFVNDGVLMFSYISLTLPQSFSGSVLIQSTSFLTISTFARSELMSLLHSLTPSSPSTLACLQHALSPSLLSPSPPHTHSSPSLHLHRVSC